MTALVFLPQPAAIAKLIVSTTRIFTRSHIQLAMANTNMNSHSLLVFTHFQELRRKLFPLTRVKACISTLPPFQVPIGMSSQLLVSQKFYFLVNFLQVSAY